MNCLDEGIIQSYIDRELTDNEISGVELHLASCKQCFAKYKQQEAIKESMLKWMQNSNDTIEIPPFKAPDLVSASPRYKRMVWLKISAACLFFILLFTTYQSHKPEQKEIFFYPEWQDQVDANLPITDQNFTITYVESSIE